MSAAAIMAWRKIDKGGIVGFAKVKWGDLEISDVKIVRDKNNLFWAFLPEKPQVNKDGLVLKEGKIQYATIIRFTSKEAGIAFQHAVLSALEEKHPDALTQAA